MRTKLIRDWQLVQWRRRAQRKGRFPYVQGWQKRIAWRRFIRALTR